MMKNDLDLSKISIVSKKTSKLFSKENLILLDKPKGITSFGLVSALRKVTKIQKIGHAGTLDPFAKGVMILLVGKNYTCLSSSFLNQDKEYLAKVHLGITTDTYDCDGQITRQEFKIPSLEEIEEKISSFQGEIFQKPPMFSAKKQGGKKLYELARKGIEVERENVKIILKTQILKYDYPYLDLQIECSKGTYVRSIAHDLGILLETGAHLSELTRTRSGVFHLSDCLSLDAALSLYLDRSEISF